MAVAALLVRKHTRKLTTGGVAYQRIVLRLEDVYKRQLLSNAAMVLGPATFT